MARFDRLSVLQTILDDGVVPLFYHGDSDTAQKVAAALAQGGARTLEFTNRGDYALQVFSGLTKFAAQSHPELIIGVGTVDDAPTAALFLQHGANFVVGPSFNEEVARLCNRHKVAYLPGCLTIAEIARAEEFGAEIIKLFPGEVGGPGFVKAVHGPRPWTRIMPTGGVTPDEKNLRTWFEAGVAAVGIGSALIRSDWIKAGNYDAISESTRAALKTIHDIRAK